MPPRTTATSVKPIAVVNPMFKLIFAMIAGAFFVALFTLIFFGYTVPDPMTKGQEWVMNICQYIVTGAFGALLGLLTGKTGDVSGLAPPQSNQTSSGS
jgi:hypothetical protein